MSELLHVHIEHKKRPRLQFLDTSMLNNVLSLQAELLTIKDLSDFYCGKIIQQLVCQELISIHEDLLIFLTFGFEKKKTVVRKWI
ncbi:MAG: hypothetical protein ACI8ZM_003877 [Crocinitomix sp.]